MRTQRINIKLIKGKNNVSCYKRGKDILTFSIKWLKWNIVTIFRLSPISQTFLSSCRHNPNGKVRSHKFKSIRDTYGGVKVRLNYCRMTVAILLHHLIAFLHHLLIQERKNSMIFSLRYVSPEKGRCIFQENKNPICLRRHGYQQWVVYPLSYLHHEEKHRIRRRLEFCFILFSCVTPTLPSTILPPSPRIVTQPYMLGPAPWCSNWSHCCNNSTIIFMQYTHRSIMSLEILFNEVRWWKTMRSCASTAVFCAYSCTCLCCVWCTSLHIHFRKDIFAL